MLKKIENAVGYAVVRVVAGALVAAAIMYALSSYTDFDPAEMRKQN